MIQDHFHGAGECQRWLAATSLADADEAIE